MTSLFCSHKWTHLDTDNKICDRCKTCWSYDFEINLWPKEPEVVLMVMK